MATKTWTGSSSTNWNDVSNWSPSGVPASGDDVVIGTTANSPALGTSTTVNTITINGSDTLALSGAATVLTATNGIALSSTGGISGFGTVAAAITASAAAHITATGGTLEVTGNLFDSSSKLTLTVNGALKLDMGGSAQNVTLASSGTLEVGGGSLSVGTAMAIGSGTIKLDAGGGLSDSSGITISTGTIIGQGLIFGAVTATGAAHITATGGTLEQAGSITDTGNALTLTITGSGDTLQLVGNVAANTVSFNGAAGTLDLASNGAQLTVASAMAIGSGTVTLDGGGNILTGASGITLNGGSIKGNGTVNGSLSGNGTVLATGGTLELQTLIRNSVGTTFQIANGASNVLLLDNTAGTGNTFAFLGVAGQLDLKNDTGFDDTISGLHVGAGGAKTDFVHIDQIDAVNITSVTGQGTTSGTITLSDGAVLHLVNLSSTNWFANAATDNHFIGTDIYVSDTPCFCRGTLILTKRGEVAVDALAVGDRVRTLSGALKPIRWIGVGRSLVTRGNKLARPIIVRAGALADNVPDRDLYLTHGHALYLDSAIGGVLIPVENLVNHRSILWDDSARVVEYYHIELEDHDVVLANGAPAESYYDAGNRALFHNTRPGSEPGAASPSFAPVLTGGETVERVWAALFERAGGQIERDTTDDPDLHLIVDGQRLDAIAVNGRIYTFALDLQPTDALHLRSRSGVPSLMGVTAHDHRRLGVAISRIELRQAGIVTTFAPDAPLFTEGGCHPAETGYCWTDGDLALPAALFAHLDGAFTLTVHTERPGVRYKLPAPLAHAA